VEPGGELGIWRPVVARPFVLAGADAGLSTRGLHAEAQLAIATGKNLIVGLSAGAARLHGDGAIVPQATLWLFGTAGEGHASFPIPLLPYVRMTGEGFRASTLQAGVMLKVPLFY
jgi:hypothetical protein